MNQRIILALLIFQLPIILSAQEYIRADISRVLVDPETNYVHIYFTGTDNPDVTHYKISQWMITGNNPFTTGVPIESSSTPHTGALEYHWTGYIEEVLNKPVGFTVGAYNSDDEPLPPPPFMPPDSTIHLAAVYDPCRASVSLQWNDYNAWRGNIQEYEINGTNADGSYSILARVFGGTTDTVISGLQANNDYLFFIIARRNRLFANAYVSSNGVRFSTPHAYYPEYIHADFGTVDGDNHPYLHFTIDSLSELNKYKLLRSEDPSGVYSVIDSFNLSGSILEYTDEGADASARPYYYKLDAINSCEYEITSSENIAGTIFLSGLPKTNIVNLEWSAYHEWLTGVAGYTIERSISGGDFILLDETNMSQYTDPSMRNLVGQQVGSEVCYRITALENPGGIHSTSQATSSSNRFCVVLPMHVRFEFNAFVPGLDQYSTFGPTMDFLPGYFDFKIFNRSGTKVFESKDPSNPRWDGRYQNGDYVPEGVYRYQLEYEDEAGNRSVLTGKVSVARE
jgi:hypothetical protein